MLEDGSEATRRFGSGAHGSAEATGLHTPLRVPWNTTMASDGPSKPLVPPPPTVGVAPGSAAMDTPATLPEDDGWLALIEGDEPAAPEPTEADADEATPEAPSTQHPTDVPSEDTAVPAPPARFDPPPPTPRRGLLPPPKSDGKRVQPVHASPRPERAARPSAAGLPSGMRPPGAPDVTEREDTDVLIASAVALLTEGDDVPANDEHVASEEAEAPIPAPLSTPVGAADEPTPSRARRLGLWLGLGAVAVLLVVFIASRSDRDERPAASPAVVAEAEPPPLPPTEPAAADRDDRPAAMPAALPPPDLGAPAPITDVGSDVLALADTQDVGGDATTLDVGSEDLEVAAEEPTTDGRHGKAKRRHKPKTAAAEPSRPAPTAPSTKTPDALLADARAALAAGQARKAYSLARKSRSGKQTSAALVVMAKAACRFGGEAQAKSAFNQLSVSARRGIRSECRSHGVRLGL